MESLEDLLDRAAEALIKGDFQTLTNLTPQIEAQSIAKSHHRTAEALHAKALRNARLLDAATRGVKAASRRISEATLGPTLTTYDVRGQKSQISSSIGLRSLRV